MPPPEGAQKTTDEKICEIITPVAMMGNKDVPESEIIFEDIIIENCKLTEQTSEQRNKSNVSIGYKQQYFKNFVENYFCGF